jgi:hypothetical protein
MDRTSSHGPEPWNTGKFDGPPGRPIPYLLHDGRLAPGATVGVGHTDLTRSFQPSGRLQPASPGWSFHRSPLLPLRMIAESRSAKNEIGHLDIARLSQSQAPSVRDAALRVRAPAAIPFGNARRRVGPPRATDFGLRASVERTMHATASSSNRRASPRRRSDRALRRFACAYVRAVRDVQTEERRRIVAEAERFVDGMTDHGGLENSLPEPWPSKESLRRH